MITVITETGEHIAVPVALQNGGAALDAWVLEQRATLALPDTPLDARDVDAFVEERAKLGPAPSADDAEAASKYRDDIAAIAQLVKEQRETAEKAPATADGSAVKAGK